MFLSFLPLSRHILLKTMTETIFHILVKYNSSGGHRAENPRKEPGSKGAFLGRNAASCSEMVSGYGSNLSKNGNCGLTMVVCVTSR